MRKRRTSLIVRRTSSLTSRYSDASLRNSHSSDRNPLDVFECNPRCEAYILPTAFFGDVFFIFSQSKHFDSGRCWHVQSSCAAKKFLFLTPAYHVRQRIPSCISSSLAQSRRHCHRSLLSGNWSTVMMPSAERERDYCLGVPVARRCLRATLSRGFFSIWLGWLAHTDGVARALRCRRKGMEDGREERYEGAEGGSSKGVWLEGSKGY